MKMSQTRYNNTETGCCARLDAARWNEREVEWKDKPFLKDHVHEVLHVPINMGSVMARDHKAIDAADAYPEEPFWLSDEVSPWGSDVYVAVDHPVPNTETVLLTGKFLTKVFEGPFRDTGKWVKAMDEWVASKGHEVRRHLFYYATCPKCAKVYGKNQVVLFAQIA